MLDYVLSALNDAVIAYNIDEKEYIFVSPVTRQVLGYGAEQFTDPDIWKVIIDPRDRERTLAATRSLSMPGEQELNYRIITPDGQTRWVQDKQVLVLHKKGNQKVLINIIKDVTDLKAFRQEAENKIWFLESLINAQSTLVFRINAAGYYTYFNESYARLLGYEVKELVGKPISFIGLPQDMPVIEGTFHNCLKHPGKVFHNLHRKVTKEGKIRFTEFNCAGIVSSNGVVEEVQGVGADVTEQMKTQKRTRRLLNRLNFYLDSITDAFFILNNNWKFVRVNKAFEERSQKNKHELIGHNFWEIFPELKETEFEMYCLKALQENKTLSEIISMRQQTTWLRLTIYPSPEGLLVFLKDITIEKLAQEESAWTRRNLEALMNNTNDLVWSVDEEQRNVFGNVAYRTWKRTNQRTAKAAGDADTSYPDSQAEEWKAYYARALSGQRFSAWRQYPSPITQQPLTYEIFFNPIFNPGGQVTGVGCFARNITKRLDVEKALIYKNRRLMDIASLSSHELRRPVATLMGLTSLLDMQNIYNPDNAEIVLHIQAVSHELDEVIRLIVNKTFTAEQAGMPEGYPADYTLPNSDINVN